MPLCDGHDAAVTTINVELARHGVEVIYLGYHCAASAIARAAAQEDVHAVGISSYNGGHVVFFSEVVSQLRARGGGDIAVFGGGGGTITPADERVMRRRGVDRIFFAGTPLGEMMTSVTSRYARVPGPGAGLGGDRALARAITLAEAAGQSGKRMRRPRESGKGAFVVGVAGPGGAGKSTLIDELTSRFLRARPAGRIAILANDPSQPDSGGAILGDRVSAIYTQDDRVFFRSLATRGNVSGVSRATPESIGILRNSGEFELILVESVGIGQDGDPFQVFGAGPRLVNVMLFVLAPHYGGRIQLQKTSLLRGADIVALNKCDHPSAHAARAEIAAVLESNQAGRQMVETIAARHHDPGVDKVYEAIARMSEGHAARGAAGRGRSAS